MDDWKRIVAANLVSQRKAHGMTQAQLAEQLHYSDKAVSKWERGESLPDLAVMKQLADHYDMLIDDFLLEPDALAEKLTARAALAEEAAAAAEKPEPEPDAVPDTASAPLRMKKHNRLMILGMAAMLVWLIATMIFVVLDTVVPELRYGPFLFIYAAPVTAIVCLVFNSIWFNPRWNYAIISVLVWSLLIAVFLTFYQYHIWKLFLIGIPAQLIILLWSRLKVPAKQK